MFTSHVGTVSLEMPLPQAFIISSLSGVSCDGFWCGVNTVFVPGGTSVKTQSNSLIKVCFSLLKSHWISDNWRHWGLWPLTMMDFCAGTSESGLKTPLQQCKRIRRCWLYLSAKHAKGAGTEWIITETTVDPPQALYPECPSRGSQQWQGSALGKWSRAVTGDCWVSQMWLFCWPGRKPVDPRVSEQSYSFFLNSNVSVQLPSQEPILGPGLKSCRPGEPVVIGPVPHSDWLTSCVATNNWGSRLWEWTSLDAVFLLCTRPCTDAWSWRLSSWSLS